MISKLTVTENAYLGLLLILFILAFVIRNIMTSLATSESIKGNSVKVTISILLSVSIYGFILLRLTLLEPEGSVELDLLWVRIIKVTGLIFVTTGFIIGLLGLIAMKNSWRVGITYEQKPDLITSGIYGFSRNPYFLSHDILIFGYILIIPSILLAVLYIALVLTFHAMITEEEKYLQSVHGKIFSDYRKRVNRYLTILQVG